MADSSWLTDDGETKIVNALASTTPFNITKWKVGDTENVTLNTSLTDVVGTVVDNGTVSEMSFNIVSDDSIQIVVILDESKGPYNIGNVGLFSDDDTLIALGTYETARDKTPNAVGVVGNRLNLTITINFVDVQSAINFNIYNTVTASWPVVQEITDLPDANLSSFENYIVREDPSQNRAITAIRNEEPAASGNFVWTLDYHNKLVADPNTENNKIEINTSTGEQLFYVNGQSQFSIIDGTLELVNDSVLNLNSTLDTNNKLAFGLDDDTGIGHPAADTLTINTNNNERIRVVPNGNIGINESDPLGKLHVVSTSLGITGVSGFGNTLILESAGYTGISILAENSFASSIYMGDQDDVDVGGIIYDHNSEELEFRVGGNERFKITTSALQLLNGTTFQFDTGSAGVPSVASVADPNSGMYFGTDEVFFSTNSNQRVKINDSRVHVSTADLVIGNETGDQTLLTSIGRLELTNSLNSYIDFKSLYTEDYDARIIMDHSTNDFTFEVDPVGGDHVFTLQGIEKVRISSTFITSNPTSSHQLQINGSNKIELNTTDNTYDNTNSHIFKVGGTNRSIVSSTGLTVLGTCDANVGFQANNGSAAEVSYGFSADTGNDTGMYSTGEGLLDFACNGVNIVSMNAADVTVNSSLFLNTGSIRASAGSFGTPAYSSSSATQTGIYFPSSTELGFSAANGERMKLTASGLQIGGGNPVGKIDNISQMYSGTFAGNDVTNPVTSHIPPGWSISYLSGNSYRITHSLGTSDYSVMFGVNQLVNNGTSSTQEANYYNKQANSFDIVLTGGGGDGLEPALEVSFLVCRLF